MPKTTIYRHSFNIGEKSTVGLARVDQKGMELAAEIQENLFPRVVGAAQFRPGTEYIGDTRNDLKARLIPFVKAVDDTALLELTDGYFRVYVVNPANSATTLVTRPSVSTTVTNGDFSSATGWTLTVSDGAVGNINSTVSGALVLAATAQGSSASCTRTVTVSAGDQNVEHAFRIVVTRGPVIFRCGTTSGGDDLIGETTLDTGTHSLAFTPTTGTCHVLFKATTPYRCVVDSITVESAGTMELAAPWVESELTEIRYDQSQDIMFVAHTNWQQRKIERRGLRSWSIVLYKTDDGPFAVARTADVSLTPGACFGNTTLTASAAFFEQAHVGALFRLSHDRFERTFQLAGSNQWTEGWRILGVGNDIDWSVTVSGTYVGTLSRARSYTNRINGFVDTNNFTANYTGTSSFTGGTDLNNVLHYYRIGFRSGNYTSGAATITARYEGDAGSGICRVTSITSSTVAQVEVLYPFANTMSTDNWLEGTWSDRFGWPSAVGFFDGRLWWARNDEFWGSISDQYYSFTLDEEVNPDAAGDAGSIQKNIATGQFNNSCQWIMPLQRLIFGTTGAETSARSNSFDQPLTPTLCTLKDASTQGSAPISPVKIDGRAIFVQRSGVRAYEIAYSVENQDYSSRNLMRLNEEIGTGGIVALAVQRQPETYVWMVRADGQVPVLLYEPGEEVAGFVRFIAGGNGFVEDVISLPAETEDRVYLIVRRTINGNTVRYIERVGIRTDAQGGSANQLADAHVNATGPVSSVTAAHLANETGLVGWGTKGGVQYPLTGLSANGSGVIQLGDTYTNVTVGIKYSWRYKSAKLAYGAAETPMFQPKIIKKIGLHLANFLPQSVQYGSDFTTMFNMPGVENGVAVSQTSLQSYYDEQTFPFGGNNWDTDSRVCLKGEAPYPVTLLGMALEMQTNE